MQCEVCGERLTVLLFSTVCDRCESSKVAGTFDRGWVIWRNRDPGSREYVFRTFEDAERYRCAAGLETFPIRPVLSKSAFQWRRSTGSVQDIELADRLFQIFLDSAHSPGPERAFLEV